MKYLISIIILLLGFSSKAQVADTVMLNRLDSTNGELFYELALAAAQNHDKALNDSLHKYKYPAEYLTYLKKSETWAINFNKQKQLSKIRFLLVKYYGSIFNYSKVIGLVRPLLTDKNISPQEHFEMIDVLLYTYLRTRAFNQYLELIQQKYAFAEENNIVIKTINSELSDMANVYIYLQQYKLARSYYRRGISKAENNNMFFAASLTNNIGITFEKTNEWDSALFYYNKALEMADESYFKDEAYKQYFMVVIQSNIAKIGIHHGEYVEAIQYINKEIEQAINFNEWNIVIGGFNDLANVYMLKNELPKSLFYLDSAIQFQEKYEDVELYIESLKIKEKVFLLIRKPKEAELISTRHQYLSDSIVMENNRVSMESAAVLYETHKKEKEIISQKSELVQNAKIINQQASESLLLRWLLVFAFLVLVLVMVFLFYVHKKNILIKSQKSQLSQSLNQQENLLKELHHRVKNNLQIVSGLLLLQANETENKEVKEMMEQGQLRIESMALLHQMLYKSTNFKSISIADYLDGLTKNIASTNSHLTNVNVSLKVDNIFIDIEKTVSLGLIVNELVTNAYKHAFSSKGGTISISLTKTHVSNYQLIVEDNGKGVPEGTDFKNFKSLGIKLIYMLAKELRANVTFHNQAGITCTIDIAT